MSTSASPLLDPPTTAHQPLTDSTNVAAAAAPPPYPSSVYLEADASFVSATPNVMYGTGESAVGVSTASTMASSQPSPQPPVPQQQQQQHQQQQHQQQQQQQQHAPPPHPMGVMPTTELTAIGGRNRTHRATPPPVPAHVHGHGHVPTAAPPPSMEAASASSNTMVADAVSLLPTQMPMAISSVRPADDMATNGSPLMAQSHSKKSKRKHTPSTAKQHQLPMFLTKTYHMIDRCDSDIATWSTTGDNFVVKNVEKFASSVLPQYFKHSNFSSFARQLNFYGFRKLKAEPILTADYDARTASYVRFFHEKFQKDKPDLLCHIKRATKSEIQSKDDVETLRVDVIHLNEVIKSMQTDFDRKISEMTFELNNKIAHLSSMYEQLIVLQHQQRQQQQQQQQQPPPHPSQPQHHPPQPSSQQPQPRQQVSTTHPTQVSTMNQNGQPQVYQRQQPTMTAGQQQQAQTQIPVSVYQNGTNQNLQVQHVTYQTTKPPTMPLPATETTIPNTIKTNGNSMMESLHKACLTLKSPAGPKGTQPSQSSMNNPGLVPVGSKQDLPDDLKLPPAAS